MAVCSLEVSWFVIVFLQSYVDDYFLPSNNVFEEKVMGIVISIKVIIIIIIVALGPKFFWGTVQS